MKTSSKNFIVMLLVNIILALIAPEKNIFTLSFEAKDINLGIEVKK